MRIVSPAPAAFSGALVEGFLRSSEEGSLLSLRVSPGAKKTSIGGLYGENALKLKVAAPPVDGKANAEVECFLAELLHIRRSRVSITKGVSSRDKVVLFRDAAPEEVRHALGPHLK